MILAMIKIYPKRGCEQVVADVLDSVKGPISTDADCLGCSIAIDAKEGGLLHFIEKWRSREAFDRHLASAHYCRVLEALEGSFKPPEIEFYEAAAIGGLELVEKARSRARSA